MSYNDSMEYVAYYRVSTVKQEQSGLGLESQKSIIKYYTGNKNIIEFTDIASGKEYNNRLNLNNAINYCITSNATLIVAKADRLSRNVKDAMEIYEKLNGRLLCCDIPNTDKFTMTIFFAIAERERELISIRTKAALQSKKERGFKLGNPNLNAVLLLDNRINSLRVAKRGAFIRKHSHIIEMVKHLYKQNSLSEIAKLLNTTNHRTTMGKMWSPTQVMRVLKI